jgi:hypothetical protein
MPDTFQRLLTLSGPEVRALNAQAELGVVRPPERSQFAHLVRHFLARFFNHETASPDGDAKTRLVQIAFAAGLPPLIVAIYLWPTYHPVIVYPPHPHSVPGPPPYWAQVNHHFFFVMYSFAIVGIATVFEWDLFFPDLIDLFVLNMLPITMWRLFAARVTSIVILIAGFLIDTGCLAPLVLPAATDPPNLARFMAAHLISVLAAGLFAAAMVLAAQSVVRACFGERLFRKVSLVAQGVVISSLALLLLLFSMLSGVTPQLLQSGHRRILLFPPYWFLGIYQRILDGSGAQPVFTQLAVVGATATLCALAVTLVAYPVAYVRHTRQLMEGTPLQSSGRWLASWMQSLLHALVRGPIRRGVFHFIGQTLLRVPRYRIYLVLYGGVGMACVAATVLRIRITGQHVSFAIDGDGFRMAIGLVAFWVIAGLRVAFISAGNRQGAWIWRMIHGDPPQLRTALERAAAVKLWTMLCALAVTLAIFCLLYAYAPPEMKSGYSIAALIAISAGLCMLLTDILFLRNDTVPFTGSMKQEQENIALTLLRYSTAIPLVMICALFCERWMERDIRNLGVSIMTMLVAHLWLRWMNREHLRLYSEQPSLDEDDESLITTLGLRN